MKNGVRQCRAVKQRCPFLSLPRPSTNHRHNVHFPAENRSIVPLLLGSRISNPIAPSGKVKVIAIDHEQKKKAMDGLASRDFPLVSNIQRGKPYFLFSTSVNTLHYQRVPIALARDRQEGGRGSSMFAIIGLLLHQAPTLPTTLLSIQ